MSLDTSRYDLPMHLPYAVDWTRVSHGSTEKRAANLCRAGLRRFCQRSEGLRVFERGHSGRHRELGQGCVEIRQVQMHMHMHRHGYVARVREESDGTRMPHHRIAC